MASKLTTDSIPDFRSKMKVEKTNLREYLRDAEDKQNPCEALIEQSNILEKLFSDPQMNDLTMLTNFFRLMERSMAQSRSKAAKLITRIPDSNLLSFAYQHLKPKDLSEEYLKLLNSFVGSLARVISMLIDLHPFCYTKLDSSGIFDRLEAFSDKHGNATVKEDIAELISKIQDIRNKDQTTEQPSKVEEEETDDPEEPPPDDFHELSVYPTLDEIFHNQYPYLRRNIVSGTYRDGTHYLDIHFRLLREDFLSPLREAICEYVASDNSHRSFRNPNVRLYNNAILLGSTCSPTGLLYSIRIDMSRLSRSINWSSSRRLIYGNLLAATFDDFDSSCFLLTVEDRTSIETNGIIQVRCQKALSDQKLIDLRPGTVLKLLETTSYFEAYRPILEALQNIRDDRLPLERYLLHCDKDVALPAYFQIRGQIDFGPLLRKDAILDENLRDRLSDVKDFSTWPTAQDLGLDSSQNEALRLALTKAVALIQGPPGCGKTFLGIRLTELFYHNRERIIGCERPILMICYTNHALDQFLSSITQKLGLKPGEVVRVGGRSNNPNIEPFLIQKLRQTRRDISSRTQEIAFLYEILDSIKKELEECVKEYYQSAEALLSAKQLLNVLGQHQFLKFIDPVLDQLEIFQNHWDRKEGGIYCCNPNGSESTDHDSDDDSDDGRSTDSYDSTDGWNRDYQRELSYHERQHRLRNRVHCRRLKELSEKDQKIIHEYFQNWLDHRDLDLISLEPSEQEPNDDEGDHEGFQVKQSKNAKKRKDLSKKILADILKEITNGSSSPADSTNSDTNESSPTNLEDDEEEQRRLENRDLPFIPTSTGNPTNRKKDEQLVTPEQVEIIRRLLSDKIIRGTSEKLKNITDFSSVQKEERTQLYRFWLRKHLEKSRDRWVSLNEQYDQNHRKLQKCWLATDQQYMEKAFIVAMTTHCASRYQEVLKKLEPWICIVEEAAEVFESHIVTAIGEQIQHLILIGDHVQLRPSPNVYTLAKRFKLDVSLFERLIKNGMPSVQLQVQHRSIPIISSLTHGFYDIPIQNHESVLNRPKIRGVVHPLYFITHQYPEENVADGTSKRNMHETTYALHLASYLVNQGYEKSEITILTTYMGQRQQTQTVLRNQFENLKGIHVTVVDNYQGEENHIVILSLVRSNQEGRLGYTGVDNRICVALSRAQNAFYVIGNFHMFVQQNPTWKSIINKVKEQKLIGTGLPIHCPNHPDKLMICTLPTHFLQRPMGGCGLRCEARLSCGHRCSLTCHSTSHENIRCDSLCRKTYADCEHQCMRRCHSNTDCLPCDEMFTLKMPHCEHTCDIPCFMRKTNQIECGKLVPYKCRLGHEVRVRCCDLRNKELRDKLCNEPCNALLECGHHCKGTCSTCLQGRFHLPCENKEFIVFHCGHSRERPCHEVGPRCEEQCMKICEHLDEPQTFVSFTPAHIHQCRRFCLNRCKHHRCSARCYEECNRTVCVEKCTRKLPCEHYCNRVCGEPCLDCLMCRWKQLPKNIQKELSGENVRHAAFVEFECGHIMSVAAFDQHFKDHEKEIFLPNGWMKIDYPRCPQCQRSLVKCKRLLSSVNKIHQAIRDCSRDIIHTTQSSVPVRALSRNRTLLDLSKLPEKAGEILSEHLNNQRHILLIDLFMHVVCFFLRLSENIAPYRDRIVQMIYDRVVKKGSIFFTVQQWLDLESEYNRLLMIERLEKIQMEKPSNPDALDLDTINDILFGPNRFDRVACEMCHLILSSGEREDAQWISILSDSDTFENVQKNQWACDGKWYICPERLHALWLNALPEGLPCPDCIELEVASKRVSHTASSAARPHASGFRRRGRGGGRFDD